MTEYRAVSPPPEVSARTMFMAGLLVDVLMAGIASRAVHAWACSGHSNARETGLVALAFDMPNHGSRQVSPRANRDWAQGNETHALDMLAMIRAGVSDMQALMDLVEGYLRRDVVSHLCLGWSLGGHCAWQAWINVERVDAAVVIIGCADMLGLMTSRASKSNLRHDGPFLGSPYFPRDLVSLCLRNDPKASLFGASPLPTVPLSSDEQSRLRPLLDARVRGKSLLLCSGADDTLVPYAVSRPFIQLLQDATGKDGWYRDGLVTIKDVVYDGVGHAFSGDMVRDAVDFITAVLMSQSRSAQEGGTADLQLGKKCET